jgi:hypothetical protein
MTPVVKSKEYTYTIYFEESNGTEPDFIIKTPTNQTFLAGVGTPQYQNHWYETKVTIPVNAPSSTADLSWSITWVYEDVKKTMYFDAVDPDLTEDEIYQRELSKFAIAGSDYHARLIIPERPTEALCNLYIGDKLVIEGIDVDINDHRLGTELSCDIASIFLKTNEHTLIWKTDLQDYFQNLIIAPVRMLKYITRIRFFVDRIIKKLNEPQVYLDSDINFALFGGIDVINGWYPVTTYAVNSMPDMLQPFITFAGIWYILNSQFMLESDLAFAYSGQAVSLDYDRTGPIESEIGRIQDYLNEHLPKAKRSALRAETLGRVGVTTSGIGPTGMYIHNNRRLVRSVG